MVNGKLKSETLYFTNSWLLIIFIYLFIYLQRIPFAVVGSNTVLEVGGKKIRGRKYPWGIVEGMFIVLFTVQFASKYNSVLFSNLQFELVRNSLS